MHVKGLVRPAAAVSVAMAAALACGPARAVTVTLDGRTNTAVNPVTVTLAAGTWRVDPLEGPPKAFAFVVPPEGCDSTGVCDVGWSTSFGFGIPVPGGFNITETAAGDYENADLAFANRRGAIFWLGEETEVSFYIPDGFTEDNAGGLTLGVEAIPTPDSETAPALPTGIVDGRFEFDFSPTLVTRPSGPPPVVWFDPEIAVGYDYSVSGALFASVTAPSFGLVPDADGYLIDTGSDLFTLLAGQTLTFTDPLSWFRLSGIDPSLMLDPDSPLAFPLGLTFAGVGEGRITVRQTPLRETLAPVPLPAGLPGLLAALSALGLAAGGARFPQRKRSAPGSVNGGIARPGHAHGGDSRQHRSPECVEGRA